MQQVRGSVLHSPEQTARRPLWIFFPQTHKDEQIGVSAGFSRPNAVLGRPMSSRCESAAELQVKTCGVPSLRQNRYVCGCVRESVQEAPSPLSLQLSSSSSPLLLFVSLFFSLFLPHRLGGVSATQNGNSNHFCRT